MRHVLRSGWSNVVITLAHEPTVCVGLMSGVQELSFALAVSSPRLTGRASRLAVIALP